MPVYYQLPCSCGNAIPVETFQAGQEVVCPHCQKSQIAPTMMRIKKLPVLGAPGKVGVSGTASPAGDSGAPSPLSSNGPHGASSGTDVPGEYTLNPRLIVLCTGLIAFGIALPLFLYVFFATKPDAAQVLHKDVFKQFGGRFSYQNSTPLPRSDEMVLAITHEDIDWMMPTQAYFYLDTIGDNPVFSDNFWQNYQTVKEEYAIRTAASAIFLGIATILLIAVPFVPSRTRQVGLRGGATWKSKHPATPGSNHVR